MGTTCKGSVSLPPSCAAVPAALTSLAEGRTPSLLPSWASAAEEPRGADWPPHALPAFPGLPSPGRKGSCLVEMHLGSTVIMVPALCHVELGLGCHGAGRALLPASIFPRAAAAFPMPRQLPFTPGSPERGCSCPRRQPPGAEVTSQQMGAQAPACRRATGVAFGVIPGRSPVGEATGHPVVPAQAHTCVQR